MSAKRFLDAVGHIDDDLVSEFVERDMVMKPAPALKRVKRLWWVPIPAVGSHFWMKASSVASSKTFTSR